MRNVAVAPFVAAIAASLLVAGCTPPAPAATPTAPRSTPARAAEQAGPPPGMIEVFVESVRGDAGGSEWVVLLNHKKDERVLPIWIGPLEAQAIAFALQKVQVRRPLTHDLLQSVISNLGATVTSVLIDDFADGIYFSKLILDARGRPLEIDSRPSDAIAIAVRTGVPIYVAASIMELEGVKLEAEIRKGEAGQSR